MKRISLFLAALLLAVSGCHPRKEITSLQRKEAANLVSEADFALSLRDYARSEALLTKAVALCPDTGEFALKLGAVRMKLKNRDDARKAYEAALAAYAESYRKDPTVAKELFHEVYLLALLGRVTEARELLISAQKARPEDRLVANFIKDRELDRLMAGASFKDISL